jgi:hypothetical protein
MTEIDARKHLLSFKTLSSLLLSRYVMATKHLPETNVDSARNRSYVKTHGICLQIMVSPRLLPVCRMYLSSVYDGNEKTFRLMSTSSMVQYQNRLKRECLTRINRGPKLYQSIGLPLKMCQQGCFNFLFRCLLVINIKLFSAI